MGKKPKLPGLARALFSKVQLRVLALFFGQPNKIYQISDVIALVKAGCLDLLQRSDGGNHLVALTAVGRAQVEVM